MKICLSKLAFLSVVAACMPVLLPSSASADATADLLVNLCCRGGYNPQIWRNSSSGRYLYRMNSSRGNLSLNEGTAQNTEGVRVYKFRNGKYEYWVWDGTLDSQEAGVLEVYQSGRILMQQSCRKI